MHAIVARAPGGPEVMEYRELVDPSPAPGEVVVRVGAAGVNFLDTYQRSGVYPTQFPLIPGNEGAGEVIALGSDVLNLKLGDRVAWAQVRGSYASQIAVPANAAVLVPAGIDPRTAAAIPLQGMTAHYLVNSTFAVGPGTTVLMTAGAGGVGRLVIQLAKAKGATVITTVGSRAKVAVAEAAGADHVIVLSELNDLTTELPRAVRAFVPGGVDVVYDGIGKDTFDASIASVRPRGLVALFGGASGQVPPFDLQRLNAAGSTYVTRPSLGHYIASREELEWRAREIFAAVADGLSIEIGLELPLSEAAEAHRALEGRKTTGKVILIP